MEGTGIRPQVIAEIIDLGKKYQVKKIVLFGSRAKGTYHEKSDIDLAILGGDFDGFATEVNETTDTLLQYDFVNLERPMDDGFSASIQQEGKVLYEKI
jgi:predicted nucleotidyltransferase